MLLWKTRNPKSRAGKRKSAFTLIEVLVVISVVSLLLGLLYAGVRAGLWASNSQSTRWLVSQVAMAVANFYNMQGSYPEGAAFSGPKLVSELGSLLEVRSASFIDTPGGGKAVVDAWGRPLIYTRYVSTAPSTNPGDSNGEGGVQPIHRPRTFELFSCGAFADRVGLTGKDDAAIQAEALKVTGGKYAHDGEKVKAGTKFTGEINFYFGNW